MKTLSNKLLLVKIKTGTVFFFTAPLESLKLPLLEILAPKALLWQSHSILKRKDYPRESD